MGVTQTVGRAGVLLVHPPADLIAHVVFPKAGVALHPHALREHFSAYVRPLFLDRLPATGPDHWNDQKDGDEQQQRETCDLEDQASFILRYP